MSMKDYEHMMTSAHHAHCHSDKPTHYPNGVERKRHVRPTKRMLEELEAKWGGKRNVPRNGG